MKWIPIDRDKNGFATGECLDKILGIVFDKGYPVALATTDSTASIDYEIITPTQDVYAWRGEIEQHASYTHYLPIQKFEV